MSVPGFAQWRLGAWVTAGARRTNRQAGVRRSAAGAAVRVWRGLGHTEPNARGHIPDPDEPGAIVDDPSQVFRFRQVSDIAESVGTCASAAVHEHDRELSTISLVKPRKCEVWSGHSISDGGVCEWTDTTQC